MQMNGTGRYELKYVLDRDQYHALVEELASYMLLDPHGDQDGHYQVTSLYFDTADFKAYWDKIEGLRFRRKVRVRVYNTQIVRPDTICSVEIKQRINKVIQKRRAVLSYASAIELCEAGVDVNGVSGASRAAIEEVAYMSRVFQLQPASVVTYDRLAFVGTELDPNLRVTFDTNMKSRTHDLSLLSESYTENRSFLPPQFCVMEIKANGNVPFWLTKLIAKHHCTIRSISKYCVAVQHSPALLSNQRVRNYQPEFGVESIAAFLSPGSQEPIRNVELQPTRA
jgi:hypothetical protein